MPSSDDFSRDLGIRTLIGEAGNQPPVGQAAVAHVILNRVRDGSWGDSPGSVVLAPGQFEPWQTRAGEMAGISKKSKSYQQAAAIWDAAVSGEIPDPTNGATHFLNPGVVRSRRGGSLPDWARGASRTIGDHAFFAPKNPSYGKPVAAIDAIQAAIGARQAPESPLTLAFADEAQKGGDAAPVVAPGSLFKAAGFDVPAAVKVAPQAAPAAVQGGQAGEQPAGAGGLFKAAGFTLPGDKPAVVAAVPAAPQIPDWAKAAGAVDTVTVPGSGSPTYVDSKGKTISAPGASDNRGVLQRVREAMDPPDIFGSPVAETKQAFSDANALRVSGIADMHQGNYLPSFPSADPATWSGGGLLKAGAGAIGMPGALVSGPINALVEQPVTQLTGNPRAGEGAGFLAGATLGLPKVATSAKAALPSGRAINALADAIGPENVPAAVARMRDNPRLSVMDVSDPVRTMAQGLIDPAQAKAQRVLSDAVKERQASSAGEANHAYSEAMGPKPDVVQMVEGLKQKATDVGKTLIEPAIENAAPIPIKPILKAIDKQIGSPEAIAGETPRIPLDPTQIKLLNLRKSITNGEMAPINERVGLSIGAVNDAIKSGALGPERLADFTEARRLLNSARRGLTSEDDLVSGLKDLAGKQKIVGPIDEALKMITKGPTETRGADFLHGVQSRLREYAEGLRTSSVGSERNMSKDLFDARDSIVGAIDKAAGGNYRPALSKYRDAMQIHESFDAGFDTLKNRSGVSGLEDRPEAFRKWMDEATPEQIEARRLGTRADIDQKINGVKNPGNAASGITKIEYNRQKLAMLFGEKEAARLTRRMDDASDMAETNAKLLHGAKTAETQAGQRAVAVREIKPGNPLQYFTPVAAEMLGQGAGLPGVGSAAAIGLGVAHRALQWTGKKSDIARNIEIARAASASGLAREKTINRLLASPKVARQLQKPLNALALPHP